MRRRFLPFMALLGLLATCLADSDPIRVETVSIPVARIKELGLDWLFRERVEMNPMSQRVPDGALFDSARPVRGTFTAPQIAVVRRMLSAENLTARPVELTSAHTFQIPGLDAHPRTIQVTPRPNGAIQIRVTGSDPLDFEEALIPFDATLVLAHAAESADSADLWFITRQSASNP